MKLAVIPARGQSKRIHYKNIKSFCGQPIITYSIKKALESKLFDKVIVSTDDDEIAKVAKEHGAEVPFLRPADISGDYSSARAAVHHAREFYQKQGIDVTYTCCIYATAPFINLQYLEDGLRKLEKSSKLYSYAVTEFEYTPYRGFLIENGNVKLSYPEHRHTRSQDLPALYHDAGQFYWTKVTPDLEDEPLVGADAIPIIIPRYLVQDIDTLDDWVRAETIYKALLEQNLV